MLPYPSTMPPLKRRPFDPSLMPPDVQQQLAAGQPVTLEDGSVLYPDGTSTGPGDSPDDFAMPDQGFDYGPGGYGQALGLPQSLAGPAGPPATAPPDLGIGGDPGMGRISPFHDAMGNIAPQFERFFATANAPFPGTPGGVGGAPLPSGPLDSITPAKNPLDTAQEPKGPSLSLPASPQPPDFLGGDATKPDQPRPMPGRIGRRMTARQSGMGARRRRR